MGKLRLGTEKMAQFVYYHLINFTTIFVNFTANNRNLSQTVATEKFLHRFLNLGRVFLQKNIMDPTKCIIFLFISFLAKRVDTSRILGVFPLPFKSHNMFFQAIMTDLAKQGHQVDVISQYELPNPPQNYKTIINLANLSYKLDVKVQFKSIQEAAIDFQDVNKMIESRMGLNTCELMSHDEVQKLIRNPPKDPAYDVIITEGLTMSCYYGFGPLLKVPIVTLTASLELPWISYNIGNPLSTAFYPTLRVSKAEIRTFWDRLKNTIRAKFGIYIFFALSENQSKSMQKNLGSTVPTIREVEKLVALSIVNTHYTIQGMRPTTPAFIEVAGLHIEADESELTGELKKWMDESKDGVVYFSLGTTVPIETLPEGTLRAISSSFAKLSPMRVLVKTKDKNIFSAERLKNVFTMSWVPQIPVLRHHNTRAFITHGGIHSVQEAIYFGIPTIGIPIFYDQYQNVDILVKKKMGIQLNHDKMTDKSLDEALRKILHEPKYREAAQYNSKLFRDRPMSPMKTATYWIEYIIRNGPQSLRSPAIDMYWWQLELLDVYGFLLLCSLMAVYIILTIFRAIFKMCFRKNVKLELKKD